MCCPWSPDELVEPFSIIGSRQKLRCKWQTKCNHLPPLPPNFTDSIWQVLFTHLSTFPICWPCSSLNLPRVLACADVNVINVEPKHSAFSLCFVLLFTLLQTKITPPHPSFKHILSRNWLNPGALTLLLPNQIFPKSWTKFLFTSIKKLASLNRLANVCSRYQWDSFIHVWGTRHAQTPTTTPAHLISATVLV